MAILSDAMVWGPTHGPSIEPFGRDCYVYMEMGVHEKKPLCSNSLRPQF